MNGPPLPMALRVEVRYGFLVVRANGSTPIGTFES